MAKDSVKCNGTRQSLEWIYYVNILCEYWKQKPQDLSHFLGRCIPMTACAVPTINLYSLSCSPSFYYRNSKRLADQARVQKNELRSKVIQDLLAAPSAFRQNGTHWKPLMGTSERCQEDNLCQLCTDHFRSLVLMEGNDFLLKFEDLFINLFKRNLSFSNWIVQITLWSHQEWLNKWDPFGCVPLFDSLSSCSNTSCFQQFKHLPRFSAR